MLLINGGNIQAVGWLLSLCSLASADRGWGPWGGKPIFVNEGQSIQSAITSAKTRAKILVKPGTYAEQLLITQSLTLIGLPGATLVPPAVPVSNICTNLAGNTTDQAGICVAGSDVELADFVAEHRKVASFGQRVKDVTIRGLTIQGFSGQNIALVATEDAKVLDNTIIDGGFYGILSDGSVNSQISGNHVSKAPPLGFISICVDDESGARVQDNQIDGSTFVGLCIQTDGADISGNTVKNTCNGAFVDPGITGAKVYENTFTDSDPACNDATLNPVGNYGVILGGSIGAEVKDNTIKRISSNGQTAPFAAGIGIVDWPAPPALATDNRVEENVLEENDFDILLYTNGTGNVVENNDCSLSVPPGLC